MPTELRAFASWDEAASATSVSTDDPKVRRVGLPPGAMWRDPERDRDGREAWGVVLPNGAVWYTTEAAGNSDSTFGWDVTGTPPRITVSPSINDEGSRTPWHGWIRDGVMTP